MQPTSPAPSQKPLISIVCPMYNEREGVGIFFEHIKKVLLGITENFEIVCINDGSKDDTLKRIQDEAARDKRVRYISLSRNFGKDAALSAGLHHTTGQAVIPIDADLQDPPELIPEMVAKWQAGFKVVLATRRTRHTDSFMKRFTAKWFYRVIGAMSTVPIPENTGDFRLMDEAVVQVVRLLPERTRFMKGILAWVGFSTTVIYFDRPPRSVGTTKYNYKRMWNHAKDGIFSFTTIPLRITTYAGVVCSFFAVCYGFYLIVKTLILGVDVPGYASIMTVMLFIGGVQMLSLGIMGEYIGRIYRETKNRPIYVIESQG